MGNYRFVAIETYLNPGEASSTGIRARPLPGQGLPANMKVECSRKVRMDHPVGTVFIVKAQVTDREGGTPFLYSSWQWSCEVVSRAEAEARISQGASNDATSR